MLSISGLRFYILIAAITSTAALTLAINNVEQRQSLAVLTSFADDNSQAMINRVSGYIGTLDGAAALITASDDISQADWRTYVDELDLATRQPEILGLGYIALVSEETGYDMSPAALQSGRQIPPVFPDTGFDERFVIKFIEPLQDNVSALGLDITFEDSRRIAAELARESGTVQFTAPIDLVQQDGNGKGYLLLRPIISNPTANDAGNQFLGWTYLPVNGDALFAALTEVQGKAFDLTVIHEEQHDYDMDMVVGLTQAQRDQSKYEVSRVVEAFGHRWTLIWNSTPEFEAANSSFAKWIVLFSGLVISLLIDTVIRTVSQREARIESDVARKTQQLRAKSEENQSVVDNAVFSICVLDDKGCIVTANKAAETLFQKTDALEGRDIRELIAFDEQYSTVYDRAQPAGLHGQPDRKLLLERNEWTTADGTARTTLLIQDVSERENTARKVAENEARWNLALEGAQIGVFDINLKTQQSVVSESWRKLMRIPDDTEVVDTQTHFISMVHPDDRALLYAADQQCIEGASDRSITEYRVIFDDKTTHWMRSDAVVVERDEHGNALRLLGAQTDVTALHQAEVALKASREQFELVLEQAPVSMALFNKKGQFIGMNTALCEMTGYSELELSSGRHFRDLVSEKDFARLISWIEELESNSQSSLEGEFRIVPKSGPTIWGLVSLAWVFDPIENDDVFIVQIIDINDKKNVEKLKSEFVATVSHELRTPLTSIKGALGLMQASLADNMPKGVERLLDIATNNTNRLSTLVNDILDLEKISSGEVEFDIEPACLGKLVTDGVEQMLPFAAQHKTAFDLVAKETDVPAMLDVRRTQQVIANLLSNACKYAYTNTKVHVRLEQVNGQALVCVINNGPPISEEFKTRIFEPFSQADASDTRAKGGTGLGLNISKQIVERMGGQIGFMSTQDTPTVFWFTVPLAEAAKTTQEITMAPPAAGQTYKVLHLEDDEDFSEIVSRGLSARAQITPVQTIEGARRAMRSDTYDVILIDWELPDGNCRDILSELEQFQPQARIIVLSATESKIRDLRIDLEMVKSRSDLDEIVAKVEKYYNTA